MSSSEQQLETAEGRKSCANNNQPCTMATPSCFAGAKKMGEPEQQQHVLTVLSKKQIKRAIGWDDANFLIIYATRTQAGCTEVDAVSLHYDCNSIWCLYLIILTSSIKTGAACIRCLEQKIGNGDAPAFVAPDDQHATRVQRKRRTGNHCTQLTRCSHRREAAALSKPSRVRRGRLIGVKGPARINRGRCPCDQSRTMGFFEAIRPPYGPSAD